MCLSMMHSLNHPHTNVHLDFHFCRLYNHKEVSYNLYQDIPLEYGREILHRQQPPYSVPHHSVTLEKGSKVAELAGAEKLMVNSMHHQSIKIPGNDVKVVGYADDGIVEAIELENYPFGIAVQWHPEHLVENDICSRRIFEGLIVAGKK